MSNMIIEYLQLSNLLKKGFTIFPIKTVRLVNQGVSQCMCVCVCMCVFVCEITNQSTKKKPNYVFNLSKRDPLLHKNHNKFVLVLWYQGSTCVDP